MSARVGVQKIINPHMGSSRLVLLIAIVALLCGATSCFAASGVRRSLVDTTTSIPSVSSDDDGAHLPPPSSSSSSSLSSGGEENDAGSSAAGTHGAFKCENTDDEIHLRWPKKFTPAMTTQAQRDRAVSLVDEEHARRLLLKLGPVILGEREKLVIGTIGGSVTTGLKPQHADYPTQFAEGLRDALTAMAPDKNWAIESRNGAQGGTGSGYFALCVNRHIAHDTDIALVELNVNDGTERAYERVHRKILARGTNTAVLEVLIENWFEEKIKHGAAETIKVVPGERWKDRLPLLEHYAVPYVTQAGALAPEVARDSKTKDRSSGPYDVLEWLNKEDVRDIREHYFISMGKHMMMKGHQMTAELLMEAVLVLVRKYGRGCKSTLRAAMAKAKAAAEEEANAGGIGAKSTYYPNIVERHTESCVTPKQLFRISRAEGWEVKDETSPRGEHKFGVVATRPGAWLNMSLDTRPTLGRGPCAQTTFTPYILYLSPLSCCILYFHRSPRVKTRIYLS